MGISFAPAIRQSSNSQGSRTSTSITFSPRSSRCFASAGVISRSSIKNLGSIIGWNSPQGKRHLLDLKFRRALLEERADAFAAIFGGKTFHLLLDFLLQHSGKFFFAARKEHALHRANRNPRAARDFLRPRALRSPAAPVGPRASRCRAAS